MMLAVEVGVAEASATMGVLNLEMRRTKGWRDELGGVDSPPDPPAVA